MHRRAVIVDYGMGNLRSVFNKLKVVGQHAEVSSSPEVIRRADFLILPGVGHFAKGISNIKELGLWDLLNEMVLVKATPIMGICLGMQLMANSSEEGDSEGFGWIEGRIHQNIHSDYLRFKVPHIGWNDVDRGIDNLFFEGVDGTKKFYFVHGYHMQCSNKNDVLATSEYDFEFVSAVQRKNIVGFQFHPEKSHLQGQKLFQNVLQIL